jgi:biotin carboxylase
MSPCPKEPLFEDSTVLGSVLGHQRAPAVVLIDPFSTGVLLQQRLFEAGYRIILVWSDRSNPACRAKHYARSGRTENDFAAVVVHEEGKLGETLGAIVAVAGVEVASVMCGSEVGVLLEDIIANELNALLGTTHLRSSGMPDPRLKVDKYMQAEIVREFGLPVVKQKLARSEDDVRAFLNEQEGSQFKAVVKPQAGAGSVGVTFCDSAEAVWKAYETIMTGEHKAHFNGNGQHCSVGVLLQEYMEGQEYIVNIVVRDGVPKCTALWKYDKRPYNGAAFVCYSKELLAVSDEPHLPEILVYTERVLKAFQFRNGAVHAEIMYTKEGPRLVEINCRLHGGNGAWVRPAELCMRYSQLSLMMDVYLNDGKDLFDIIPAWPVVVHGGCYQVKMRSHVSGTLEDVRKSHLDRIIALPSYEEHFFSVRPGGELLLTVDMPSVPGEVTLVHNHKETLDADYTELNNILHEGIFNVTKDLPLVQHRCLDMIAAEAVLLDSMSAGKVPSL